MIDTITNSATTSALSGTAAVWPTDAQQIAAAGLHQPTHLHQAVGLFGSATTVAHLIRSAGLRRV